MKYKNDFKIHAIIFSILRHIALIIIKGHSSGLVGFFLV